MDGMDIDNDVVFQFEDEIAEQMNTEPLQPDASQHSSPSPVRRPKKYKQQVCKLWLRNSCVNGDECNFLHSLDESRMPVCHYFIKYGECKNRNCIYKHEQLEQKECHFYKDGFCPRGSSCRFKHKKVSGPPPPVEEVFKKIQEAKNPFNNPKQTKEKKEGELDVADKNQGFNAYRHLSSQSRYFIIKSDNMENLELSIRRGMWATTEKNEDVLNDAFGNCDKLVLLFSVNRTGHFQGFALMKSFVGCVPGRWQCKWNGKILGKNFMVKWVKTCELAFGKTRHLKNSYNENLPVQISRDCQEVEPSIGQQLVALIINQADHPTQVLPNDDTDWDMERHEYVKFV